MQADEGKHDGGNDEDVDGKKAAQGGAADSVPSQNEARQPIADQGNATGLFGRYDYRPCSSLIPAQQLTGKSHSECETKQQHAGRPGHLAWVFVATEQKGLRHMGPDH